SLWFLISLFSWHMLLIGFKKMHPAISLTTAVALGIIVGYFDPIGHLFSLSRTFVFFPFFLLGHFASLNKVLVLKQRKMKILSVVAMSVIAIAIYFLPDINSGWLLASKSYSTLGVEIFGRIAGFTDYVTAFVMAASFLAWVPRRRFAFTKLGVCKLYVNLLHGLFSLLFRHYEFKKVDHFGNWIGLMVLSSIIVILLSTRTVMTIWQPLVEAKATRLQQVFEKFNMKKSDEQYNEQL